VNKSEYIYISNTSRKVAGATLAAGF